MGRRDILIGGLASAWAATAPAQQAGRVARIGFLSAVAPPDVNLDSFRQGMQSIGYAEGRHYTLEARYAHHDYTRFPALVQELLGARVELIVTAGASTRGAPFAAQSVPVVFAFSGDPVDAGIVASLARPGGNATGISLLALDLAAKRPELLKEAVPAIRRIAVLANPDHPGEASELRATRETAQTLGMDSDYFPVSSDAAFEPAYAAIARSACHALLTFPDALTLFHRQRIAAFALSRGFPSVFGWKDFAQAGGLISYGPIRRESYLRVAYFVDKILKGAKPAELPVEQPTKLELVINLKTAKAPLARRSPSPSSPVPTR